MHKNVLAFAYYKKKCPKGIEKFFGVCYNGGVAMKVITTNKRASFEYFVLEKFDAGIVLEGGEVKSVRAGHISINDTYVVIRNNEAYILNSYIKPYSCARVQPDERRPRKLLLNRDEIDYLEGKISTKGLTIVPLKVYLSGQFVKVEIALCKGKLLHDKREVLKQRDVKRDIQRELKENA